MSEIKESNVLDIQDEIPAEELTESIDEDGAKLRVYKNIKVKWLVAIVAISMSLFHVYGLGIKIIDPTIFYTCHWGLGLFMVYLMYPSHKSENRTRVPLYDWICAIAVLLIMLYVVVNTKDLLIRSMTARPSAMDLIAGAAAILLTLEAGRRTVGKGLPIVAIVLILSALVGNHLPSLISNKGYSIYRIISYLFSTEGIFGTAMKMSATNVFLMVLFGSFLTTSGTGDFFMRLAISIAGGSRGGPAKVSVVSSGLFGSISGSAVANVVGTGTFTIPLMKRVGYKPEFAAAVEAVASTGGQIMPPVMGTGAFIMAEMLNIPYSTIALAALIPALLYYYSVFISIDLEAAKNNLQGMEKEELERPIDVLREGWFFLIPIFVFIWCLAIQQYSVSRSALISILTSILFSMFSKETRMTPRKLLHTLELGSYRVLSIVAAVGCAGLAIGVVMLTGLGIKFTLIVSTLAGNVLLFALLFSALAAIILGMGLPTVAAYIICSSVMASGLVKLGIEPIAAHMFLFYYSILSMITPPVALAAYTAAGISDSNPVTVGFLSMRLGAIAFILPFFFIYGPSLLFVGTGAEITMAAATAIIGINCFTIALYGWYAGENMSIVFRIILCLSGLCLIFPGSFTDAIGLAGILVFVLGFKPLRNKIYNKLSKRSANL